MIFFCIPFSPEKKHLFAASLLILRLISQTALSLPITMDELPYTLVIDFETANTSATSACSLGLVVLKDYQIIHRECFFIRPPTSIFLFTHIHGLTWSDVKSAKTFQEVWNEKLQPWFSQAKKIVAHNIAFDLRVLTQTAQHYGFEIPDLKRECTVKLSRDKLSIYPSNLKNVSNTLGIELNHHEAMSDALASAYIYIHAKTGEKPWIKPVTPEQLSLFDLQASVN